MFDTDCGFFMVNKNIRGLLTNRLFCKICQKGTYRPISTNTSIPFSIMMMIKIAVINPSRIVWLPYVDVHIIHMYIDNIIPMK